MTRVRGLIRSRRPITWIWMIEERRFGHPLIIYFTFAIFVREGSVAVIFCIEGVSCWRMRIGSLHC